MTYKKGYTLIEILIVIALFLVLFSISFPSTNFYKKILERQEISEFRKDLFYARNMAIIDNKSYYVNFTMIDNSYSVDIGMTKTIKKKAFGHGLKLNNAAEPFIFLPSGASDNAGTIFINTDRGERYRVSLTPATSRIEIILEEM